MRRGLKDLGGFPNVYRRFILGPSHGTVGRLENSTYVVRRTSFAKAGSEGFGVRRTTNDVRRIFFFLPASNKLILCFPAYSK